jgi:hypothetical protein
MVTKVDISRLRDAARDILRAKEEFTTIDLYVPAIRSIGDAGVWRSATSFAERWDVVLAGLLAGIDQYSNRLAQAADLYAQADRQEAVGRHHESPSPAATEAGRPAQASGVVARGALGDHSTVDELIPGSTSSVSGLATTLRDRAKSMYEAWSGFDSMEWDGIWRGTAATAFVASYEKRIPGWRVASEAHDSAAGALEGYAAALNEAKRRAGAAIDAWSSGNHATANAALEETRQQLDAAATSAIDALDAAAGRAGELNLFWSEVGSVALETLRDVTNAVASVGQSIINHPENFVAIAGGIALADLGAGGEVGGLALDATGVGAVIGVPANVVSAGVIVAGVGSAGAGIWAMTRDAAGNSRVEPWKKSEDTPHPQGEQKNIGGSGKPRRHFVRHPNEKAAKEAAKEDGEGAPMKHPNPAVGRRHYHPTDKNGEKSQGGVHHEY